MSPIHAALQSDHDEWLQQQHRYEVLSHVYRRTNADCTASLTCTAIAEELGYLRDDVFQVLHDLEFLGYLAYVGSGPRVRLTPRALSYLLLDSGRRRSIRGVVPR